MTREEIINNLKYTIKKHKDDKLNTFDTNISMMCKDILDYLKQEPFINKPCISSGVCEHDKNKALILARAEIENTAYDWQEIDGEHESRMVVDLNDVLKIIDKYKAERSEEAQPKQIDDSCLNFDFDKVKEILKKDDFNNLVVDHTCEEKQEQTGDEKMISAIDFAIRATDSQDDYSMGMRNGMRYVKSLIDGKEPQYELRQTDKEIKLGIDIGDEVVNEWGAKGVVIGIDTSYEGEVLLSLLMRNHKVPQLVVASSYKTKTGRHFPQIIEVLEQIKGELDGK